MATLEFFFDCSSPWTYLAFHRVGALAEETGATLVWRPILVGGVFNAVNPSVYEQRAHPVPVKARYYAKDLQDWARHLGLVIAWPSVFPVNSVKAMRGAYVALDASCLPAYARAVFEAYWRDGADISRDDVLAPIVSAVGLEPGRFLETIATPACKARLRAATDELVARGGFGSPTMFVDGADLYFGNDRIELVRAALLRGTGMRASAAGGVPPG
jgi:2-hydroxychromene-2-carboxylate isomerase